MTDNRPPSEPDRYRDLFQDYSPAVYRYALRAFRGDTDMANEIVQQVFLAVWQQFDRDFRGTPDDRVLPLIMRMAHCRVKDVWRQDRRRPIPIGRYLDDAVPVFARGAEFGNPLDRVLTEQELARLWQILMRRLTESEYRIALLAWDLGLSDAEIARDLGRSLSTVYSHKSNARKKIQAIVNDETHRIEFDDDRSGEPPTEPGNGGEVSA
ncbi:RNA polymerase sigma factor [Nocardia arthritidis]|uniref:RNA polymerase sigma factor SigS n=1 Tax=Nocardia arthritidis TaxID=228602 RepID=A0A6G9YI29_9NOCA|nr:sigma-70 family RNA polymerase sigma factor [Nocardia arthritidis]QIS12909.1 sigma-70 family RNA polymerase sigma factor [Nocardia arthritidis]